MFKAIAGALKEIFAEPEIDPANLQSIANDRVGNFRRAMENTSYINSEHRIIEGHDVLEKLDNLGIALGIHANIRREQEFVMGGPMGGAMRPTEFTRSMGCSETGWDNDCTPYIEVPADLSEESYLKSYLKNLDDMVARIENAKAPEAAESLLNIKAERVLDEYRYDAMSNEETAKLYENIVRTQRFPEEQSPAVIIADGYEGTPLTGADGQPFDKNEILQDILGPARQNPATNNDSAPLTPQTL